MLNYLCNYRSAIAINGQKEYHGILLILTTTTLLRNGGKHDQKIYFVVFFSTFLSLPFIAYAEVECLNMFIVFMRELIYVHIYIYYSHQLRISS
jgi:hypothetical protein